MKKYHKIQTVYLRDPENRYKTLLDSQFACPEFEYLKDNIWVGTEKVDGTNIRIMNKEGSALAYEIGGKTDNAQIPSVLFPRLQEIGKKLAESDIDNCCLYGEGYGAKIQRDLILFDIKIGDVWLERHNVYDIAEKLNIKVVAEVFRGTLREAVEMAKIGFTSRAAETKRTAEGLVLRPEIELFNRMGHRIITKIKHKDFKHD